MLNQHLLWVKEYLKNFQRFPIWPNCCFYAYGLRYQILLKKIVKNKCDWENPFHNRLKSNEVSFLSLALNTQFKGYTDFISGLEREL